MKKILISGYFGYENFGDEALLYSLIKSLIDLGARKQNITVLSNNPTLTSNQFNVKSINRWNIVDFINALLNHNTLIFTGGLFQDRTSFKSFLYYVCQLILASIFQKTVVLYGAGIGPINRKISRVLFDIGIKSANIILVRDEMSATYISRKENTFVTCDPVWSIEPLFTYQNKITSINWQLPILGISLRSDKNLKYNYLANVAEKVARVLNEMKDWQAILIPCMPQEDLSILYEFHDLLTRKISNPAKAIVLDNFTKLHILEQAGILARCDVMLGMRYHSLIVPLAHGKPVCGLIYDQKVKSLIEFSEQIGVSFKDDFDQVWNYFWQNIEHSSNMAKKASEKAKQIHTKNLEMLHRLVRTGPN